MKVSVGRERGGVGPFCAAIVVALGGGGGGAVRGGGRVVEILGGSCGNRARISVVAALEGFEKCLGSFRERPPD